jgi:hypothetical protein
MAEIKLISTAQHSVSPHFAVKHLNKKVVTKKSSKIKAIVSIVVLACLGLVVAEAQTKVLRHTIDNFVYDNKNHYLPCKKLPPEAEVRTIVQDHQDVIQAIERVNPGFVGVEIDTSCAGKADLLIWYGTHENRLEIERIIGGDTFFGIPYRLNNR